MTENKFETVSSLVDNNQHDDEAFNEVINDEEMSDTWQRYHLIGDVMRKESPATLDFDLSTKISDAILQEPSIIATANKRQAKSRVSELKNKVIQFAKPFGQVAIAASAAGLMVLGVQQNNMADNDISPSKVIQTSPFGGIAEPVSLNYQQDNRMAQKQAFIQQQRRFQALLSDHHQQLKFSQDNIENKNTPTEKVEELPK